MFRPRFASVSNVFERERETIKTVKCTCSTTFDLNLIPTKFQDKNFTWNLYNNFFMLSTHLNDQTTNERYKTVVSSCLLSIYVYIAHTYKRARSDTTIVQATGWARAERTSAWISDLMFDYIMWRIKLHTVVALKNFGSFWNRQTVYKCIQMQSNTHTKTDRKCETPYVDLNQWSEACVWFHTIWTYACLSWRIRYDTTAVVINSNNHTHKRTKAKFVIRHYVIIWLCGTIFFVSSTSSLFIMNKFIIQQRCKAHKIRTNSNKNDLVLFMFWYSECSHHNHTNTWAHGKHWLIFHYLVWNLNF